MRKWTTRNLVIKSCLARITLLLLSTLSIIKGIGAFNRRRVNTALARAPAAAFFPLRHARVRRPVGDMSAACKGMKGGAAEGTISGENTLRKRRRSFFFFLAKPAGL